MSKKKRQKAKELAQFFIDEYGNNINLIFQTLLEKAGMIGEFFLVVSIGTSREDSEHASTVSISTGRTFQAIQVLSYELRAKLRQTALENPEIYAKLRDRVHKAVFEADDDILSIEDEKGRLE